MTRKTNEERAAEQAAEIAKHVEVTAMKPGEKLLAIRLRTVTHYAVERANGIICQCGSASKTRDGIARNHARSALVTPGVEVVYTEQASAAIDGEILNQEAPREAAVRAVAAVEAREEAPAAPAVDQESVEVKTLRLTGRERRYLIEWLRTQMTDEADSLLLKLDD